MRTKLTAKTRNSKKRLDIKETAQGVKTKSQKTLRREEVLVDQSRR